MQIKGKVSKILPLETGVSKAGKEWSKQSFVIGFQSGTYDKILCIDITSPKTLEFFQGNIKEGDEVNCDINVESRSVNERYFTNCSTWKVEKVQGGSAQSGSSSEPEDGESGTLPF